MPETLRSIRPVVDSEKCEGCREKEHVITELRRQIERLTHAVQRDADFYEVRAVNDGKAHVRLRR